MVDVVDKATRSRMMSGIKSKNTKPEVLIRSLLHKKGFRFRIHSNELPGKPDIVLKKYNAVVFINGCFWHGHNCHLFKWPKTRRKFWEDKINNNKSHDKAVFYNLRMLNWRICLIWECSIKYSKSPVNDVIKQIDEWLKSDNVFLEIRS